MYQLDNSQNVMVKATLFSLLSMSTFTDLNNAHIEKFQIYKKYYTRKIPTFSMHGSALTIVLKLTQMGRH